VPREDLVDEGAVVGQIGELARATQQQGVLDGALEMPVRALHRTLLVGHTAVVARGPHAIVGAQGFVAPREILPGVGIQILERRRHRGPRGRTLRCPVHAKDKTYVPCRDATNVGEQRKRRNVLTTTEHAKST